MTQRMVTCPRCWGSYGSSCRLCDSEGEVLQSLAVEYALVQDRGILSAIEAWRLRSEHMEGTR